MKHTMLDDSGTARRFAVVFDTDDEVVVGLRAWAQQLGIQGAAFSGIGAFRTVTLGFFDPNARDYARIMVDEQVEVLSLAGNIALAEDQPKVHAHVVVGKRDGTAHGSLARCLCSPDARIDRRRKQRRTTAGDRRRDWIAIARRGQVDT